MKWLTLYFIVGISAFSVVDGLSLTRKNLLHNNNNNNKKHISHLLNHKSFEESDARVTQVRDATIADFREQLEAISSSSKVPSAVAAQGRVNRLDAAVKSLTRRIEANEDEVTRLTRLIASENVKIVDNNRNADRVVWRDYSATFTIDDYNAKKEEYYALVRKSQQTIKESEKKIIELNTQIEEMKTMLSNTETELSIAQAALTAVEELRLSATAENDLRAAIKKSFKDVSLAVKTTKSAPPSFVDAINALKSAISGITAVPSGISDSAGGLFVLSIYKQLVPLVASMKTEETRLTSLISNAETRIGVIEEEMIELIAKIEDLSKIIGTIFVNKPPVVNTVTEDAALEFATKLVNGYRAPRAEVFGGYSFKAIAAENNNVKIVVEVAKKKGGTKWAPIKDGKHQPQSKNKFKEAILSFLNRKNVFADSQAEVDRINAEIARDKSKYEAKIDAAQTEKAELEKALNTLISEKKALKTQTAANQATLTQLRDDLNEEFITTSFASSFPSVS